MKILQLLIFGWLLSLLGVFNLGGCPGNKAIDTTEAVRVITAGEANVQHGSGPGELLGAPGTTFTFPSAPGKNVELTSYYENGQMRFHLVTKRDEIINALFAGAMGADAQKFAADAAQREFFSAQLDKVIALAQVYVRPPTAIASTPTSDPTIKQQLADAIKAELAAYLASHPIVPASQPK